MKKVLEQKELFPLVSNKNEISVVKKNLLKNELFSEQKVTKYLKRILDIRNFIAIDIHTLIKEMQGLVYSGISSSEIYKSLIMASCMLIEKEPEYSKLSAHILIESIIKTLYDKKINDSTVYEYAYRELFKQSIEKGIEDGCLDKKMAQYNLENLANYIKIERDNLFDYMGIFTLSERYFMKINKKKHEIPQGFWMRIAMGLALNEKDFQEKAKQFYDEISCMNYTPSTPTLFHSGFKVAQLSSCYLNVSQDDLGNIFKTFADNAQLSKWAGGLGTAWSKIRASGAYIKSIRSTSQGVIPYLKIADDVIGAITKAGIRRGGKCAYLEVWHYDIEDFIDLRRNTGDHRRRTHDMNTATWICDLFLKRVEENANWTLFSPHETPELTDTYGKKFEEFYVAYEKKASHGEIELYKIIPAKELWKKILMRLFETGHPWITFKDTCNIRSPQDHCGTIYSSNLCTEITLNTSIDEIAVCNLGSINISRFFINDTLDYKSLKNTIKTAIRMLDNIIDLNFYPVHDAKNSNIKHRPIGLGIMGFQDLLYKKNLSFIDQQTAELTDEIMEYISYYAIEASCELAQERGTYKTYQGSKWSKGIFPFDTIEIVEKERGKTIDINKTQRLNWQSLKKEVAQHGIRNSNMMAIAPTATISTITGSFPSIEPSYKNLYVKSNVSGEFTIINTFLVEDLKKIGLWNTHIQNLIKFYDGSIQNISDIPEWIRKKYLTSFEIDQKWLLYLTALRGKWIDQSQSHNVFFQSTSGKDLESLYLYAWNLGLKTTYYLRTLGKSQIEKSTLDAKEFGFTQMRHSNDIKSCTINNEGCESCQ
jgi:ribonucleoside-diphosphate reductase alpha chain